MNEELDQIKKNNTWELVPRPKDKNIMRTKWVFKNKLNEEGKVIRNKAKLVCKGYTKVECIDFDKTFAPIARLDAIRMFLAFAYFKKIKVHQLNVEKGPLWLETSSKGMVFKARQTSTTTRLQKGIHKQQFNIKFEGDHFL